MIKYNKVKFIKNYNDNIPQITDKATRIVEGLWLIAKLRIVIAIIGGTDIRKNLIKTKASKRAELVFSPVDIAV